MDSVAKQVLATAPISELALDGSVPLEPEAFADGIPCDLSLFVCRAARTGGPTIPVQVAVPMGSKMPFIRASNATATDAHDFGVTGGTLLRDSLSRGPKDVVSTNGKCKLYIFEVPAGIPGYEWCAISPTNWSMSCGGRCPYRSGRALERGSGSIMSVASAVSSTARSLVVVTP